MKSRTGSGSSTTGMRDDQRKQLEDQGYLVLKEFMSRDLLEGLRLRVEQLFAEEGERAGSEFKQEPGTRRLANLVDKGEVFEQILVMPAILEYMSHLLGPRFKLSSLNVRSTNPHSEIRQPLHADLGAVPDERGYWVGNSIWLLDDFTSENGALRLVPGSHRRGELPQDVLDDPFAPHPNEILITARAGAVVIINAHIWHGGTENRTASPRRAMHAFYTRWDKPQQQYQRKLLRPEVQERLSPQLRKLLALDDPLNDQLSSTGSNRSGFLK